MGLFRSSKSSDNGQDVDAAYTRRSEAEEKYGFNSYEAATADLIAESKREAYEQRTGRSYGSRGYHENH